MGLVVQMLNALRSTETHQCSNRKKNASAVVSGKGDRVGALLIRNAAPRFARCLNFLALVCSTYACNCSSLTRIDEAMRWHSSLPELISL